jgi:hypothetical protein
MWTSQNAHASVPMQAVAAVSCIEKPSTGDAQMQPPSEAQQPPNVQYEKPSCALSFEMNTAPPFRSGDGRPRAVQFWNVQSTKVVAPISRCLVLNVGPEISTDAEGRRRKQRKEKLIAKSDDPYKKFWVTNVLHAKKLVLIEKATNLPL